MTLWTLLVMAVAADEFRDFKIDNIQSKEACTQAAQYVKKEWVGVGAIALAYCVPVVVQKEITGE